MKTITFKDINKEQQEKVLDFSVYISNLQSFSERANNKLFVYIFGKKAGDWHYHENFYAIHRKNILTFFLSLNNFEKELLITNLLYNPNLYDNC